MLTRKLTVSQAILRYRGRYIMGPDGHGVIYGGYCEEIFVEANGTVWLIIRTRECVDDVGIVVYLRQSLCTVR